MTFQLVDVDSLNQQVGELQNLATLAKDYAKSARSKNTNRAYSSDWNDFIFWCKSKNLNPLPAEPYTIAVYLSDRAANEWMNHKEKSKIHLKFLAFKDD